MASSPRDTAAQLSVEPNALAPALSRLGLTDANEIIEESGEHFASPVKWVRGNKVMQSAKAVEAAQADGPGEETATAPAHLSHSFISQVKIFKSSNPTTKTRQMPQGHPSMRQDHQAGLTHQQGLPYQATGGPPRNVCQKAFNHDVKKQSQRLLWKHHPQGPGAYLNPKTLSCPIGPQKQIFTRIKGAGLVNNHGMPEIRDAREAASFTRLARHDQKKTESSRERDAASPEHNAGFHNTKSGASKVSRDDLEHLRNPSPTASHRIQSTCNDFYMKPMGLSRYPKLSNGHNQNWSQNRDQQSSIDKEKMTLEKDEHG